MCSRKDTCYKYSTDGESGCTGCPHIEQMLKLDRYFQIALAIAVCAFVFTTHVIF